MGNRAHKLPSPFRDGTFATPLSLQCRRLKPARYPENQPTQDLRVSVRTSVVPTGLEFIFHFTQHSAFGYVLG